MSESLVLNLNEGSPYYIKNDQITYEKIDKEFKFKGINYEKILIAFENGFKAY